MSEYETGSNWKSPEEQEFEKALNLTPEEVKVMESIDAKFKKAVSDYTFFMRDHQANPDRGLKCQFTAALKGLTLEKFTWLTKMGVETGLCTRAMLVNDIISYGVAALFDREQEGFAIAALHKLMLAKHAPPEVTRAAHIDNYRKLIEQVKKIEDQNLKESLEGGAI